MEFSEESKARLRGNNVSALASQLYTGGLPGINYFAAQVVLANFSEEELTGLNLVNSSAVKAKLNILKLVFSLSTGDAVLDAYVDGHHGSNVLSQMRATYTKIINSLNESVSS